MCPKQSNDAEDVYWDEASVSSEGDVSERSHHHWNDDDDDDNEISDEESSDQEGDTYDDDSAFNAFGDGDIDDIIEL